MGKMGGKIRALIFWTKNGDEWRNFLTNHNDDDVCMFT